MDTGIDNDVEKTCNSDVHDDEDGHGMQEREEFVLDAWTRNESWINDFRPLSLLRDLAILRCADRVKGEDSSSTIVIDFCRNAGISFDMFVYRIVSLSRTLARCENLIRAYDDVRGWDQTKAALVLRYVMELIDRCLTLQGGDIEIELQKFCDEVIDSGVAYGMMYSYEYCDDAPPQLFIFLAFSVENAYVRIEVPRWDGDHEG